MQLLILFFLLMYIEKGGGLEDVKPLIKDMGDEEFEKVIDNAEQMIGEVEGIASVFSAINGISSGTNDNFRSTGCNINAPQDNNYSTEGNSLNNLFSDLEWLFNSTEDCDVNNGDFLSQNIANNDDVISKIDKVNFPLTPIINIADDATICCLAKYFSCAD